MQTGVFSETVGRVSHARCCRSSATSGPCRFEKGEFREMSSVLVRLKPCQGRGRWWRRGLRFVFSLKSKSLPDFLGSQLLSTFRVSPRHSRRRCWRAPTQTSALNVFQHRKGGSAGRRSVVDVADLFPSRPRARPRRSGIGTASGTRSSKWMSARGSADERNSFCTSHAGGPSSASSTGTVRSFAEVASGCLV